MKTNNKTQLTQLQIICHFMSLVFRQFENQNVFYYIKKTIKMALMQFEFIWCPIVKQRICSRVGAVICSPFIRASLFLAASSLCFLMMASLARSALPCSVFPSLWSFRMSSFDFCFSISSLMERTGVQHKYHTTWLQLQISIRGFERFAPTVANEALMPPAGVSPPHLSLRDSTVVALRSTSVAFLFLLDTRLGFSISISPSTALLFLYCVQKE